jgi:lycopene cyclase domain-containing protein
MDHYLYLLINGCAVCVPFIWSFHQKIRFSKLFYAAIPAIILTAVVFIAWDIFFTRAGVWGFNPRYITCIYLLGLPLEEILFFISIPYACLFTYYCLSIFFSLNWNPKKLNITSLTLAIFLFICGILNLDKAYTASTCISTSLLLLLFQFVIRVSWMGKLLKIYPVLLLPFFIVNGLLTGTTLEQPVVWYNNDENLDIRLLSIPVEDVVYGFELIMLNVFAFEWLKKASPPLFRPILK